MTIPYQLTLGFPLSDIIATSDSFLCPVINPTAQKCSPSLFHPFCVALPHFGFPPMLHNGKLEAIFLHYSVF